MLTVGDKLPAIKVPVQQGTSALPAGETIDLGQSNGRWKIIFYWPKDFTFVCPTEIIGYGDLAEIPRIQRCQSPFSRIYEFDRAT